MEKQAQENLLKLIETLKSSVDFEQKGMCLIIPENYGSNSDLVRKMTSYIESMKCLIFNKIIDFTNQYQINIKEFNEINDCLNHEFYNIEEYIDDVLPELYDRNISEFREIYFQLHSSLSMIGYTIKHL